MTKYLMFDHGGVLDGQYSETPPTNDDLFITSYSDGGYQILKNGVSIVRSLNRLVAEHGYEIVFHSKNKAEDQLKLYQQLVASCRSKGLSFPKVSALAVCDPAKYPSIQADAPLEENNDGILMACYGVDQDDKACVRTALSKILRIDKHTRSQHIVFEDGSDVILAARKEGYTAYLISPEMLNSSLNFVLQELLPKPPLQKLFGTFFGSPMRYRDPGKSRDYYAILDLKETLEKEIRSCFAINRELKTIKHDFLASILTNYDDNNGKLSIRDCVLTAKDEDESTYNMVIQGFTSRSRELLEGIIRSNHLRTYNTF